jgi:hypothetical protein
MCQNMFIHGSLRQKVKKGKAVPVLNRLCTTPLRRMEEWNIAPPFVTPSLVDGEWSSSRPGLFTTEKAPPVSTG